MVDVDGWRWLCKDLLRNTHRYTQIHTDTIIMNVNAPVVATIKKSRLKQSTKETYNNVLKAFSVWLKKNADNVSVKKYKKHL